MKNGSFSKTICVVLTLLASVSLTEANESRQVDVTKRQTDVSDKRVPFQTIDLEKNNRLNDRRFPIKQWHGEYSSLGNRRSSIDVRETREKTIIEPQVIEMNQVERRMARSNRRMADLRNADRVEEKKLAPRFRDAEVVHVQQMSRPDPSSKQRSQPLSMRELNRFSFQRNHSDADGLKVDRAASSGENE